MKNIEFKFEVGQKCWGVTFDSILEEVRIKKGIIRKIANDSEKNTYYFSESRVYDEESVVEEQDIEGLCELIKKIIDDNKE